MVLGFIGGKKQISPEQIYIINKTLQQYKPKKVVFTTWDNSGGEFYQIVEQFNNKTNFIVCPMIGTGGPRFSKFNYKYLTEQNLQNSYKTIINLSNIVLIALDYNRNPYGKDSILINEIKNTGKKEIVVKKNGELVCI